MAEQPEDDAGALGVWATMVVLAIAGVAVGWLAGGRWQDAVGGAFLAMLAYWGLVPLHGLREISMGALGREIWVVQLPWILLALVITAWLIDRGVSW